MVNKERMVVMTGATRGLGRAMVGPLVAGGCIVVGCGRDEAEIRELRGAYGSPHDFYAVDVSRDDEVKSWASLVLTNFGPPDLLINNAGVINRNAELWEIGAEEFDRVLDVNVKGTANVLRHFLPSMVKVRKGVVVNFSSGWGRSVSAEVAPYCASKWAVEGMTRALAEELPSTMAAIPLNPGVINTQMLRSCFGSAAAGYPSASVWAEKAVPFLLSLGPEQNGQPLSCP